MSYNIIRHRGMPRETRTLAGVKVTRQEQLFVPEWGVMIGCAPYDDHFVYLNPDTSQGSSAYLCTCGSPAVVVPPGPEGMFVCLFHATYGSHTTSHVNLKDFGKVAGETIEVVQRGKKWQ